jgi:hypothetical protein
MRRAFIVLTLSVTIVLAGLTWASPASAATLDQKVALLNSFTQPTSDSYNAWNWARNNRGAYADYALDWSTDYCTDSPDEPLGFDFRIPCWHHDFGYGNYKAVGRFPANKDHIDNAFYFDLKAKCATYSVFVRPVCYSLAWTYYQAVHFFGSVAAVSQADLDRAASYKAALERAAARRQSAPGE